MDGDKRMSINIGRSLRWYNSYEKEIEFCKLNKVDFMQIWFRKGKLLIDNIDEPREIYLKNHNFPLIIHAVFEMDEYDVYDDKLIELLKYFGHTEVIIHPISPLSNLINDKTIYDLAKNIERINIKFKNNNIKLFIENNSRLDKINYTPADLKIFFASNPDTELLLDIAHIDSYEHLQNIIKVKYPKMLHISDKHFSVEHEHLPVGMGELDFDLIFTKYLNDFYGDIIFEIPEEDAVIIDSIERIRKIIYRRLLW